MTTINKLAKEQTKFIHQQLKTAEQTLLPSSTEDEELVRRATFAVRNKSVVFERYISRAEMLYVTVQDVRPALVEVNFINKTIACSCPQKQMCRHKLAVILSLYQYIGSVQDWVARWRATKTTNLKNLANDRTPESWLQLVDAVLERILVDGQKVEAYSLVVIHTDTMAKLMRAMPFEREWQPLFKLFMEVTVLNRVWKHLNATNSDVQSGLFMYFVERSSEKIIEASEELAGKSRLFATDPFYDTLQNMIRSLVLERNGDFTRRLAIYKLFWKDILHEKARREKELALLEQLVVDQNSLHITTAVNAPQTNTTQNLTNPTIQLSSDVDLVAVRSVFYILLRQIEKLAPLKTQIQPANVSHYYELALFAKKTGEQWATEQIVRNILPHLNQYLNHWLNPVKRATFIRDFHTLFDGMSLTEQEELDLYGAMGKFGLQPFSSYLISKQRYMQWAALHQQHPSSISFLEMCGLKEVLEIAPGAVLPLLHVYAMEEIRGRSRMNYKQAVRIWKRMKAAAKKAGKAAYFENYMQTIRAQNKRLRALLEEIEKGNLLA